MNEDKEPYIFRSFINSFYFLYKDAEHLRLIAEKTKDSFESVVFSRNAILLYVLSLEGLINRVIDNFLPSNIRSFFVEREQKFSTEDKWQYAPLIINNKTINKSIYPWSHYFELIKLRNEFVHPKHDRAGYYKAISTTQFETLSWKDIPKEMGIKEADLVFRQSKIPKDPYAITHEDAKKVKKIIDDTIKEFDKLLNGIILKDNWLESDNFTLVYPPDAELKDISLQ